MQSEFYDQDNLNLTLNSAVYCEENNFNFRKFVRYLASSSNHNDEANTILNHAISLLEKEDEPTVLILGIFILSKSLIHKNCFYLENMIAQYSLKIFKQPLAFVFHSPAIEPEFQEQKIALELFLKLGHKSLSY